MTTHLSYSRQSSGSGRTNYGSKTATLFIQECGMKLDARETTIATGCMLFQRCRRLMQRYGDSSGENSAKELGVPQSVPSVFEDDYLLSCGCLLLAGKVEENHLNVRKLINVAYNTVYRDRELTSMDDYYAVRNSLMTLELWILRLMNFQPACHHPHKFLVCFLKAIQDWLPRDVMRQHPVAGVSWALLRDAYSTSLILDTLPEHLALAIIACALEIFHISVPVDESGRSWTKVFCSDLDAVQMDSIVRSLIAIYSEQETVVV